MNNNEALVTCRRCEGNACYEQKINEEITTWLCMGCGFTTATNITENSDLYINIINTAPELYKDLAFKDNLGYIWFPATITIPEKGMVFIDGTDISNWKWAAVKAIPIPTEDSTIYPENVTHKMDTDNILHFNHKEFMDALEQINFFNL